jgi:serine/threonine protein kinase
VLQTARFPVDVGIKMDRGRGETRHFDVAPGASSRSEGATNLIGATLGSYRITGELGQGGMGTVFLAEHTLIARKVAIKLLDPHVAAQTDAVSRFFAEARAVNEIRHPNIVDVTDMGTHAGRPFIVMEYLGGMTLEQRLARQGRLSLVQTVHVARQMASALEAAHTRGMVHRDLKPANVMLLDHPDYPDFVKVLDFGIAKLVGQRRVGHQTEAGTILGTPAFMSPEQCLGDETLDHRSDIYSLGVMLFQMLSGRLPFEGEAIGRLFLAHVHEPPPKLTSVASEIPEVVSAIVERALAKKPDDRFASMRELRRELEISCGRPRSITPVLEVVPSTLRGPTPVAPTSTAGRVASNTPTSVPITTPSVTGSTTAASAAEVAALLTERVQSGTLPLPTLPALYRDCLRLLADPGYSVPAVAALIRSEGRLAAHVVRRANTDGPSGGTSANPEKSMSRLGSERLRVAIWELGARATIDVRDPRFEDIFRKPWQHAVAGAVAAERLARLLNLDALVADGYLAALLRDAGISLLSTMIPAIEQEVAGRKPARPTPVATIVELVNTHARAVTLALMRHWQVPRQLNTALEKPLTIEPAGGWSLHNLVAAAAAFADKEGFYLRREALDSAPVVIDAALRDLNLTDLRARRVADRFKEAVKLRE